MEEAVATGNAREAAAATPALSGFTGITGADFASGSSCREDTLTPSPHVLRILPLFNGRDLFEPAFMPPTLERRG